MQEFKSFEEYIEKVCMQIRWKKAHGYVARELADHMEDRKAALIRKGQGEQEAEVNAISHMGDPVVVGLQLDITHRPKQDWTILLLLGVCIGIGLVIQFVTSYCSGIGSDAAYSIAFARTMILLPVGFAIFLAVYLSDYLTIVRNSVVIFVWLLIDCQALTMSNLGILDGAHNYMIYAALALCPVYAAMVYRFRGYGYKSILWLELLAVAALLCFVCAQGFMACFVFSLSSLVILTVAIIKNWFSLKRWKALLLVYVPTFMALIYVVFGEQSRISMRGREIVLPFFTEVDPYGNGYVQSIIRDYILPNAKFLGGNTSITMGNGQEMAIQHVLPLWWSDYSLAYIAYRFGYGCAIGVVAVVLFLLARMMIVTIRQNSEIGFIVCLSVTVTLFIQMFFYTLTNLGCLVAIPGPLPFITYGTMSFLTNMFLVGMFLSAYRNKSVINDIMVLTNLKRWNILD